MDLLVAYSDTRLRRTATPRLAAATFASADALDFDQWMKCVAALKLPDQIALMRREG